MSHFLLVSEIKLFCTNLCPQCLAMIVGKLSFIFVDLMDIYFTVGKEKISWP